MKMRKQPVKKTCRVTRQTSSVHYDYGEGCRVNTIAVQSPVGPTTVIINPETSEAAESATEPTNREGSSSGTFSGPPVDITVVPGSLPVQPRNIEFPSTSFSGKSQSFNSNWYSDYCWFEYSVSRDAVYCFPCRFFTSGIVFQ